MASPRIVAAAACLLLSGLVVGGSCASLAFADPDSGHGGSSNGGGSSGGGASGGGSNAGGSDGQSRPGFGFGFGGRPGGVPGGGSADAPKIIGNVSPGDFGVRLPTRPGTSIGDGRNGRIGILPKFGDAAPSAGDAAPSAGNAAPSAGNASPDPSQPPAAGDQSTRPATAVPSALPAPTATETGNTVVPTSAPSAVPAVPLAGAGGIPSRGWWSTPNLPRVGPVNAGQVGSAVPPVPAAQLPGVQLPGVQLPTVQLPTELPAAVFSAIGQFADQVTGLATAAAALPFTLVQLPVVVPPVGAPGKATTRNGGGAEGGGVAPRIPPTATVGGASPVTGDPVAPQEPPRPKEPKTFEAGGQLVSKVTQRAGYDDYLRAAGVGQVAAVAVPGVSGILLLTGAGGFIGYRQARAGSVVRSSGSGRFMS